MSERTRQTIIWNTILGLWKQHLKKLTEKFGRNFEEKNLRRMLQFAEQFTDKEIVVTLSRHLSWSHFLVLIPLKKIEAKLFYAQKVANEALGVRDLRKLIETKTFERTTIANLQTPTNNQTMQPLQVLFHLQLGLALLYICIDFLIFKFIVH